MKRSEMDEEDSREWS